MQAAALPPPAAVPSHVTFEDGEAASAAVSAAAAAVVGKPPRRAKRSSVGGTSPVSTRAPIPTTHQQPRTTAAGGGAAEPREEEGPQRRGQEEEEEGDGRPQAQAVTAETEGQEAQEDTAAGEEDRQLQENGHQATREDAEAEGEDPALSPPLMATTLRRRRRGGAGSRAASPRSSSNSAAEDAPETSSSISQAEEDDEDEEGHTASQGAISSRRTPSPRRRSPRRPPGQRGETSQENGLDQTSNGQDNNENGHGKSDAMEEEEGRSVEPTGDHSNGNHETDDNETSMMELEEDNSTKAESRPVVPSLPLKNMSPKNANDTKTDDKSTSPTSQYATRRRTRGMAQEKPSDFITGQDEVDQYIIGVDKKKSPTKDLSPRKDSELVGPVLYKPGEEFRGLKQHMGKRLVVHIDAKYITTTNDQVADRQIWGNSGYTADSDVICILLHSGSLKSIGAEPPEYFGIALYLHILPGRDSYIGSKRGPMRSRNWSEHDVTLKVDKFEILQARPENWASCEQLDGGTKKKGSTSTTEDGKRKRRRKEVKQEEEDEKEDNSQAIHDDTSSTTSITTSNPGGRSRRGKGRGKSARSKEEQLTVKSETQASNAPTSGLSAIKQESLDAEAEADADVEEEEKPAAQAAANKPRIGVSTRSGRLPPPSVAPKKRVRRRPANSAAKAKSEKQQTGENTWKDGERIDGLQFKEEDSMGASLDESDSEGDGGVRGRKRTKVTGCMKVLEKIARLDRWMPQPTDAMRYNLSYEPCYQYASGMLADCSFACDFWFSTRLRSYTLYVENDTQRFEFSYVGEAAPAEPSVETLLGARTLYFPSFFSLMRTQAAADPSGATTTSTPTSPRSEGNQKPDGVVRSEVQITREQDHDRIRQAYGHYRWAEVRHPYNMGRAEMKKIGVPLPNDPSLISVLETDLTWEEVEWGDEEVCVRGRAYPLRSLFWVQRSRPSEEEH